VDFRGYPRSVPIRAAACGLSPIIRRPIIRTTTIRMRPKLLIIVPLSYLVKKTASVRRRFNFSSCVTGPNSYLL
jgi:hypothetical protein